MEVTTVYNNDVHLQKLISTVQCTNVRFKDHRLVDTDDDTDADRMGPDFSEATDLTTTSKIADKSPEDDAINATAEDEDVTNQTFSVTDSTCDSTFVVGESVVAADVLEASLALV